MIKKEISFSAISLDHIRSYDNKNFLFWNSDHPTNSIIRSELRHHYKIEQQYQCSYCQLYRYENHGKVWDIDHIVPKQQHPEFLYEPKNLTVTCKDCNNNKSYKSVFTVDFKFNGFYSLSPEDYLIIHPHIMEASDHLELHYDNKNRPCLYNIKTIQGAFTFKICNLKRIAEIYSGFAQKDDHGRTILDTQNEGYLNLLLIINEQSLSTKVANKITGSRLEGDLKKAIKKMKKMKKMKKQLTPAIKNG